MNRLNLLYISVLLLACSPDELPPGDYARAVRETLTREQALGDYIFRVEMKTPEMMALENIGPQIHPELLTGEIASYGELSYFYLTVLRSDQKNLVNTLTLKSRISSAEQLQSYFAGAISLAQGNRTFNPVLFHLEMQTVQNDRVRIALAFEKGEQNKDVSLLLDGSLLGTGPVKFQFRSQDINNLPTLAL